MGTSRVGALVPWVPVLTGIGILAGYMVYAIVLSSAAPSSQAPQLPPQQQVQEPAEPAPSATADPGGNAEPPEPGVYPVEDSPGPDPPTESPPPEPPQSPEVVGKYRVVDTFRHEFVGKVVLANSDDEAQDWTVELAFGPDVGELNEFWVDGAQQPTLEHKDDRFVFTSSVPIEPGARQVLKFHFDRSGWDLKPTVCTANGAACTVSHR